MLLLLVAGGGGGGGGGTETGNFRALWELVPVSKNEVLATLKAAVSYSVANFLPVLLEQLRKNASVITFSLVLSLLPTSTGFGMEGVSPLDKERRGDYSDKQQQLSPCW